MPDYTAYPGAADIEVLLKSIAAWPTDTTAQAYAREEAQSCADAAQGEWERRTGWLPFLSTGTDETQSFLKTDHYGILNLRAGLLSCTSIVLSYSNQNDGPQTLTEGLHFVLMDMNAPAKKLPYTEVKFRVQHFAYTEVNNFNTIQVTGKWGYCTELPADAWKAILRYGADSCLSALQTSPNLTSISQDGFSKTQDVPDSITQRAVLAEWGKNYKKVATLYTRVI